MSDAVVRFAPVATPLLTLVIAGAAIFTLDTLLRHERPIKRQRWNDWY